MQCNTPDDAKTTFKTNEPNANEFLEKLPGFELILVIFGMLAMAGHMKQRAETVLHLYWHENSTLLIHVEL